MSGRVTLIYDADYPQVGSARSALLEAFGQSGLTPAWSEWERNDPKAPAYARSCGSPTILVDGQDVAPPPVTAGNSCCRLYAAGPDELRGAPPAKMIAAALQRDSGKGRWAALLAAIPGAVAAVLPACPFCWPLYAGALSALGLGYLLDERSMPPLAGALLLLALAPLGYRARARRGYGPLSIGVLGAGAILLGKFVWMADSIVYVGLASLVGASLWNIRPLKERQCSRCEGA